MNYLNNLCGAEWVCYVLDILIVVWVLVSTLSCGKKGFVNCLFGVVSGFVALILSIVLCSAALEATNGLFGLQEIYASEFENIFMGMEGFDADISASGVQAALETQNVSAVLGRLVLKITGGDDVPAGTTLAMVLGEAVGSLAATLTCSVLLFILIRVLVKVLSGVLNGIVSKLFIFRSLNSLLGSVFGFLNAVLWISVTLALLTVIPLEFINEAIGNTFLASIIYEHNPLVYLFSMFL